MERQNVSNEDGRVVGWFGVDSSTAFDEGISWDADGVEISLATGQADRHERLYRPARGRRWVRQAWTGDARSGETWRYMLRDEVKEWLLLNGYSAEATAVAMQEDYSGGILSSSGRPAIGPIVRTSLPQVEIDRIDAAAKAEGIKRSEWVRRAILQAVDLLPWDQEAAEESGR